ncbi:MAG: hypothetical protein KGL53_04350 [Elusimicrobia bacterium]|nr:hypothetical protein [Elusimicrobiota bacterium]
MRFWVWDKRTKRILGPYSLDRFKAMPGLLSAETKVAPEGSTDAKAWRMAKDVPVLKQLLDAVGTAENPELVEEKDDLGDVTPPPRP